MVGLLSLCPPGYNQPQPKHTHAYRHVNTHAAICPARHLHMRRALVDQVFRNSCLVVLDALECVQRAWIVVSSRSKLERRRRNTAEKEHKEKGDGIPADSADGAARGDLAIFAAVPVTLHFTESYCSTFTKVECSADVLGRKRLTPLTNPSSLPGCA